MKSQCPSCRSFNNADAVFCDQCGSRIRAGGRLPAPRREERARPRGSVPRALAWTLGGATLGVIAFLAWTEFFGPEKNSRPGKLGVTPEVLVRIDEVDATDATQTVRRPAGRQSPVTDFLPFHKLKPLVHRGIVQLAYLDEDGDKLETTALGVLLAPSGDVITRLQPMLGARSGVCVVYGRRRVFRIGGAAEIDADRDLALLTLLDPETGEPVEIELPLLDPLVGEEAPRALHPGQEIYAFGKPMGWDKDWVLTEVAEYPYYGSSSFPRLLLAAGDDDVKEGAFVAVDPGGVVIGLCSRDEGGPDESASLVVDPVIALEHALGRPATLSLSQISMRYFDGTFADFARRGRKAFARDRYADACERFFQALDQADGREVVTEADLAEARSFLQRALDGFRTRARDRKGWGELVGILEKAVEYLAGYRELWLDLANAYMSTANYRRAVEAAIETLKLGAGEDVTGLLQLAYLKLADQLAEQGDSNSAAHAILEGINYLPGSARLHMSLAKIYMSWRFYEDASRVFQIAGRLDLAYSDEVQLYLERIEDALSRREAVVIPWREDRPIIAVVVLDGFAEYDFVVDTGASKTSITQRMAAELGYSPDDYIGMATVLTAKGRDRVGILRLGAVSLQGYTVRNIDVFVLNNALDTTGLLGLNFLKHFKVTVDSSRGEFRLESP